MFYKIIKFGNSTGITLPKKMLALMDIEQGEEVMIEPDIENRTITIKPIKSKYEKVNAKIVEGTEKFINRYSKALKNLAER